MNQELILAIPLAFEWSILATTVAPLWLAKNPRMWSRPRLALTLWFIALFSSIASLAFALVIAFGSTFDIWIALKARDPQAVGWIESLLTSFGAWGLLAAGGIVLAIVNLKLEPLVSSGKEIDAQLGQVLQFHKRFQGVEVQVVNLALPVAFTTRGSVVVSSKVIGELSEAQLNAVLWHELGHLRGWHSWLKAVARFVKVLTPGLVASKVLLNEVNLLTEFEADSFALKHCRREDLAASLDFFCATANPTPTVRLRQQRLLATAN